MRSTRIKVMLGARSLNRWRDEFEIGSPIDTEMNKLLKKSKQTDHFWFLRCYTNKEHLVHVVWTESNGAGTGYRQLYKRFLEGKGVCCRSHHDPVTKDKESAIAVDVDGRRRRKRIQNGQEGLPFHQLASWRKATPRTTTPTKQKGILFRGHRDYTDPITCFWRRLRHWLICLAMALGIFKPLV